ncbi:MAG: glycosyltransferase family 39 protein [Elusimicrobia bacterium]|nr:glycosyltransferase family 39 protein [Elusimicrobiota bacterium]
MTASPSPVAARRDRGWRSLLAVGLFAFAVRAGYVLTQEPWPLRGDALGYHQFAVSVLERGEYRGPHGVASRPPGYPLFLAAVYAAFGEGLRPVQLVQCVLGSLSVVMIMAMSGRWLPGAWPLAVGLFAACFYGLVEPCRAMMAECLYAFLTALAWLLLTSGGRGPGLRVVGAGAVTGLAALVRPEGLLIGGAALAVGAATRPRLWRPATAALGILALGAMLAPWAARNWKALGKPVAGSTNGSYNLYLGLYLPLEAMGLERDRRFLVEGLPELEADRVYGREFRALARRTPPSKFVLAYVFNAATHFYPFLPGYDLTFMLLLPFWLGGMALAWSRPELRPAAAGALVSIAVYTVFGGPVSRYRHSHAALQMLLGSAALAVLLEAGPPWRRLAAGWAAANAAVWALAPALRQAALWLRDAVFR